MSVAFLPYVGLISNCISRLLTRHNMKTIGLLPRKVTNLASTASPVKVMSVFVKPGSPLRPRSRSTTGTSGCIILVNQPVPSTA